MKKSVVILAALLSLILAAQVSAGSFASAEIKKVSMGVGFGIPYGVLGTNMDIHLVDKLDLSFGFGSTLLAGMGYNFGFKYHLSSANSGFRPRISAYYGTNSVMEDPGIDSDWYGDYDYDYDYGYYKAGKAGAWRSSSLFEEYKSYTGLTLGFGTAIMFGSSQSNGIDFDILYIATTGYNKSELEAQGYQIAETGRIKISVGYRRAF